ncbi:hypothetical protein K501DRAFT_337607 [Backusella circina FSU 941]|nr:hypothetical protein K501DRAFT_337607 [Backusella circina FSU 941]
MQWNGDKGCGGYQPQKKSVEKIHKLRIKTNISIKADLEELTTRVTALKSVLKAAQDLLNRWKYISNLFKVYERDLLKAIPDNDTAENSQETPQSSQRDKNTGEVSQAITNNISNNENVNLNQGPTIVGAPFVQQSRVPKRRRRNEEPEIPHSQNSNTSETTDSLFSDTDTPTNYGELLKKREYILTLNEFGNRFLSSTQKYYMNEDTLLEERLAISHILYQSECPQSLALSPLILPDKLYSEIRNWRRAISSDKVYILSPVNTNATLTDEDVFELDLHNMLMTTKKSIDRTRIKRGGKKSEIDFIVENVALLIKFIFDSNIVTQWEKASVVNNDNQEGCLVRTDFLIYDKYQELGCGEVKIGGTSTKLLEEDRARLGETMKRQLHHRIHHAKSPHEFSTFGIFIYGTNIELFRCYFTNEKEYHFTLLKTIILPTERTTYNSMEETLEFLISFKECIISTTQNLADCEAPYIYHDYLESLKPTISFI